MHGVTILDHTDDNFLAVNLIDILYLLGAPAQESEWDISGLECLGSKADELHQIADDSVRISGAILFELAAQLTQVIDGVFVGYKQGKQKPWIIVRAVDSSAYDVESSSEEVLASIRQNFQEVVDIPSAIAPLV
ncbi:MAG: hypothetical protein F6K47_35630 [Symploca sp. SIO2E6]|nr:hypothetical protein [Symploca sp. SIO2E6]